MNASIDNSDDSLARAVLGATGLIIVVTEIRTGLVVSINPAAEALTGFRADEVLHRPVWETLISKSNRASVQASYADPSGSRVAAAYDGVLVTKSGYDRRVVWSTVFLTDDDGSPTHVAMTGIDVSSDRTHAGTFGHLMRAATTAACIGTDLSGRVTFCSTGAEQLLGYTASELVGQVLPLELFDPSEIEERAARLGVTADLTVLKLEVGKLERRRADSPDLGDLDRRGKGDGRDGDFPQYGDGERAQEWTLIRKDGTRFSATLPVHSVTIAGQPIGYLGIADDVTERQRTHGLLVAALQRERDGFERIRALDEAKSSFVATASHELRTPITSIAGFTELLQDGSAGALSAAQKGFVDAIARNGVRLRALTDDLLILSGLQSGAFTLDRTDIDLRDVVVNAWDLLTPITAGRQLEMTLSVPDDPVVVNGDPGRLERVVLNLVSNAVKFTPDGGTVSAILTILDDEAVLDISDTGIGIPREEQEGLFTQFFRASSAREREIQGTGLGLSIVAPLVSSHDGSISVASEHLRGAQFTVRLPLAGRRGKVAGQETD